MKYVLAAAIGGAAVFIATNWPDIIYELRTIRGIRDEDPKYLTKLGRTIQWFAGGPK